jgi:glyoxylase-like metal-dependent hydrolase (beta-lactamase superfamily II)
MLFLTEPEPPRGIALPVLPGIARVVAPNPGVMTYHGTNTYLIDTPEGCVVLDPGPDDAGHVRAILAAAGGPIARILLSHAHRDHAGGVAALREATGAPVHAYAPGAAPDLALEDGDVIAGLVALHTPGHASDHLCFAAADGTLFSADHVMSWGSSVVSPPDGDMVAYFASLRRLLARDDRIYLPGHGPPLPEPRNFVAELLRHREAREAAIAAALGRHPVGTAQLVAGVYGEVHPGLLRAAERTVIAHLLKLEREGRAARVGESWRAGA